MNQESFSVSPKEWAWITVPFAAAVIEQQVGRNGPGGLLINPNVKPKGLVLIGAASLCAKIIGAETRQNVVDKLGAAYITSREKVAVQVGGMPDALKDAEKIFEVMKKNLPDRDVAVVAWGGNLSDPNTLLRVRVWNGIKKQGVEGKDETDKAENEL